MFRKQQIHREVHITTPMFALIISSDDPDDNVDFLLDASTGCINYLKKKMEE